MRIVLTIFGGLLALSGLMWAGQGAGIIPWPKTSFMVDNRVWILYGLVTAAVGVALVLIGRRRR